MGWVALAAWVGDRPTIRTCGMGEAVQPKPKRKYEKRSQKQRSGEMGFALWGIAPRPAIERGSMDPVLAEYTGVFQTNSPAA